MKKVIHIHSDHKFIEDYERYLGEYFNNTLIILDAKNSFNNEYHNKAFFFDPNPVNLNKIVALVNAADLLVIYNLDFFKSQIVNGVDKGVKIIWRFFGTELYSRKPHLYLSPKSMFYFIPRLCKEKVKSIFSFLFPAEKMFYRAMKRSDAFACVFPDEYVYLSSYWNHLPRLIPLSLEDLPGIKEINFELEYPKNSTLVIGNSRSYYNNHIDILELVERCNLDKKININILFNYGVENAYTNTVRDKTNRIEKAALIDAFIPPNEFINFYGPVAAFVNNSYRQLALGNIFMALYKGVKVYLNKINPTYAWLKKAGFYIYEMEDLKSDLESGQIYLTKNEITHNLECMRNLNYSYTQTDFQLQILQLLKK